MQLTFKILLGIFVLSQWMVRFYYQNRYRTTHAETVMKKHPKREKYLVVFVSLSFIVPVMLWWFSPVLDFANLPFPHWLRWVGFAVAMVSTWYFYLIHKQLGDNWSPVLEIRSEHKLITNGVYKHIRHPMYTSILLSTLGANLVSANWLMFVVNTLAVLVLLIMRLPDEEQMMTDQFGNDYRAYMRRTWLLIPNVL
jgi:protein-S-isoprenylcysteine O-methyltransferase Ste14